MWWLAICLLLVSAVTVADARHGCTTCPSNGCPQNEAHIGFCNDSRYVSESYQCSDTRSELKSRIVYYSCGVFNWARCAGTRTYYETVTHYHTCYRNRRNCQRRCCSGFQSIGERCEPHCTGGCRKGGVCIDPEVCECPSNWQGQYCEVDVNECDSNNGGCSDHCSNNPGSYSCYCRGYADLDPDGRRCTCRPGFIQNDVTVTCDDINECADNNGGCEHRCINTPGSHRCQCNPGYELHGLRRCLPICTGGCLNGGECVLPETCSCPTGWTGQNCEFVVPVIQTITANPSTGISQGMSLSLTCKAVGGPTLNVMWTTPTGPRVGSVISVDSVTADDAGDYRCEVKSAGGTANDSIAIRVGVHVEVPPMGQSVNVNDTLRLSCNVSGSEPISYQWLKDGVLLQDDGRVSGSINSLLMVKSVKGNDFGGYQCNASNDVDQVLSEVAMVAVAPVIVTFTASPSTGVSQGMPLNLTCEAVGGPTLNVAWATPTGPRVGSVIFVDIVTTDDAGDYRCEVTSEGGTASNSITVRVGVRMEVPPMDQSVNVNDTLLLTCMVSGSEPISYQWLKDGVPLQDNRRMSVINNNSILMLEPVEGNDFGWYQCNASNDVDQVLSKEAMVAVAPVIVNFTASPFSGVSQGMPLYLTCEAVGGPTLNVTWTTPTGPRVGSVISVDNVTADDAGDYRCEVTSEAGTANDSTAIRVGVRVEVPPMDQSVKINSTLRLSCNVSGSEPISYQWLKDGVPLQDDVRLTGRNDSMLMVDPVEGNDFGGYQCNASNDVDQVLSEVAVVAVAPVIVNFTASPSLGVSQGMPLYLTCEAVGGPTLNVTWTTPTGPRVGSVISVDSVTADDAGDYRCEVTSEAGTANDSITIRVGVRMEVPPMDQSVNVNDTLLLACVVSGSEPIFYQWLKDGVLLQDDGRASGSNDIMLMVEPVEGDDFGGYQCNASNDVDQVLSEVAMVAVAPVIVNFTASPFPGVSQGTPLNLTCEAVGGPTLNVTWTTPTGPRVGSVMSVDSVTADDAGDYRCEVTSEAGTANNSISIRVGVRMEVPPMDQSVNINDTLLLSCMVSGNEPISYQWLKDGVLLQDDGRVSGSNDSMLIVEPVEGDDFGEYQCSASNDVDQVQSEVAMVAVSPNGTVVVMPVRRTVSVSGHVTFSCVAEGGPNNTIQWSLSDANLPGENDASFSVTRVDAANGGNYTCTVRNRAGVEQDTAELFVNPILLEVPTDMNISLFENGMFTCKARGFPTPTVSWYRNGRHIDVNALDNVDVTVVMTGRNTTSILTITNATYENSGKYYCSATSSDPAVIGVNCSEVDVIVRHTPEQPVNVTVTEVTPFSVALAWVEPHNNNAPISDYIITIDSRGTDPIDVRADASVEAFNVTGLRPFVNYSLTVAAENDEGVGQMSIPVVQQTLEFFPTAPLNLYVSSGRRSVNVTWSTPTQPNGVILFYQLEYSIVGSPLVLTLDVPADSLAASLLDLTPAQVYEVTVRANTSVGFGSRSGPVTSTTGTDNPSAPLNLTATNVTGSANSVTISWAQPLEPNGIILTYEVAVEGSSTPRNKREADVTVFGGSTQNVSNTTTSVIITNLTSFSENTVTVRAYTSAGPGLAQMVTFLTGEDTSLAPRNLSLEVASSKSIIVSWTRPVFFRGQFHLYEVIFASDKDSGLKNITGPMLAVQNSTTFLLAGLKINTMYDISVRAVTGAGPGENVTGSVSTAEDAPPPVTALSSQHNANGINITWIPPGLENGEYFYRLLVSFESTFSTDHPERSEKGSFVHEFNRAGTDNVPFSSFLLINTSDDTQQQVASSNMLPHRICSSATYSFSMAAVNRRFNKSSIPDLATLNTQSTPATPVTNLRVVAKSNNTDFTLRASWKLPYFPNGRIKNYILQCKQLDDDKRVSTGPFALDIIEKVHGLSCTIYGLPPFTFFEVTVYAMNDLPGFTTSLTVRTNASVPDEPPTVPSGGFASHQCLSIPLLIPSQDTGILIRYDIIVFGPTSEGAPSEERRLQLANMAIKGSTSELRTVQTFHSLAEVMAATSPLEYCTVPDSAQYFVFFRLEFQSDGSTALVTTSEVMTLTTQSIALPVVLVVLSVALIAGIVVTLVVVFVVRRYKKSKKYKLWDEQTAMTNRGNQEVVELRRFRTLAIPQCDLPSSPIPVEKFPEHVKKLHSDENYHFSLEYKNVEPDHNPTIEASSNPVNARKNRYDNITCYDHSRVRLTPTDRTAGSDYINGNFLDGYRQPNAFIATQGPIPGTVVDFWRMVWEQDTPTIVMLTKLEEDGKIRCHRYWPTEMTSTYGEIRVTIQEELELPDYTIRTFSVVMCGCHEERIVTQLHFTAWPDFGVPAHPTPLLFFIRRGKALHPSNRGPIVVHCSAGVGRSGTFVTLHTQMSRIVAEKNVDVFGFVRSMRSHRCLMVQTEAQYIFIHDALLEVVECGMTEVPAQELPSQFKYLQTLDEASDKTLLELELQRLAQTLRAKKLQSEANKAPNKKKNRFGDILPYDESRCRLTSVFGVLSSDYINASFINGYVRKHAFIATQDPLRDTVDDFWQMVWEYKSASIVMLTKEEERTQARCHRYWPNETDMYGQMKVVLVTENEYSGYIQREFKLINTKNKDKSSLPVRQFQFTGWPEESGKTLEHGADLIDLIGQVQKWQRTAGDRPVVVHCSDGSGRTGTYIAVANLLDRLKTEGVVDVFQTVRALRMQRPCMVHTLEQYHYCYSTVVEYLESSELQATFE